MPPPPGFSPQHSHRTKVEPLSSLQSLTIEDLIEEFEHLADWEERCDFLIDLGFELPEFPPEEKTEANRVHGCQSLVWLVAEVKPGDPPVIEIRADSDAMIVKGLIAVLLTLFSGKTPGEILETDAEAVFARLGLDRHLSTTRRNGLYGMMQRVREIASANLTSDL
ncbi:MAG: SufE family protein [Planctomycetaceae bacterium]